ncbi:MAG: PorV/PorQ family protein [Taibaiella sp.]|nr:PorV/PorQ family protein [Taibaiella sp.]
MKQLSSRTFIALCALSVSFSSFAGNKDRVGQSGATEMIINPWARSTGMFGLNGSFVNGIEAMKTNIAGLAFDTATEIGVSHGVYLTNTGIDINNLALAQPIGNDAVLGLNIMSMSFGDITATDYNNPDGYGTYHPQLLNIQLGYAKQFGTHINAGAAATYISEQINNVTAQGLAFEGGVQYITGKKDNFHLGVTLRNLGTNMRFSGTGLTVNGTQSQSTPNYSVSQNAPSEKFGLPTYLNLGVSYDIYLDEHHLASAESAPKHKLSVMANFTSNSYINDYLGAGAEYTFNNMFSLRAAYRYEKGITDVASTATMYVGLSGGATVQTRIGTNGPTLALDYSFRPTQRPANGVHMISLRFTRATAGKSSDSDDSSGN